MQARMNYGTVKRDVPCAQQLSLKAVVEKEEAIRGRDLPWHAAMVEVNVVKGMLSIARGEGRKEKTAHSETEVAPDREKQKTKGLGTKLAGIIRQAEEDTQRRRRGE
ncbi:hypothetical protein FRB96_003403 [Tulasnella sp. 330]|nr:hypothetical protein FRB96_003403 [Tulasnella sp. 330]